MILRNFVVLEGGDGGVTMRIASRPSSWKSETSRLIHFRRRRERPIS
jgi:hypothetical protein